MGSARTRLAVGATVVAGLVVAHSTVVQDFAQPQSRNISTVMKRIYTGTDGKSHVQNIVLDSKTVMEKVTGIEVRITPPGRFSDWHVGPKRQYIINLSGHGQIGLNEETIDLPPGSVEYIDDLTGRGHTTRTTGTADRVSLWLTFEDQHQKIGPLEAK